MEVTKTPSARDITPAGQRAQRYVWPHGLLLLVLVVLCCAKLGGFLGLLPLQIGLLVLSIVWVFALRDDVFTAAMLILVQLVFDWYQLIAMPKGFPWVSLLMAMTLTGLLAWRRRDDFPWVARADLVLWALLLLIGALAIPRSLNIKDAIIYWINVLFTAFVLWLLGNLLMTNRARLRELMLWLSVIATFIAIHTIIEGLTGVFLLATPHLHAYLASENNFILDVGGAKRSGSFLLNPDSNGAYLAFMLFLPAGLLFYPAAWWVKALHLAQIGLIFVALLFTYTTAAWLAAAIAAGVFVLLAGRARTRIAFFGGIALIVGAGLLIFPHQAGLLLKHATGPNALTLRRGAWETALHIIAAKPLTGIGLGTGAPYIARDLPYRSPLEYIALPHPHNSFLELAALAGLPLLLVYVALMLRALVSAVGTYRAADWTTRPLLAGVFAGLTALTVHAFADATWTLPPLVLLAWLLVGALSSRALRAEVVASGAQELATPGGVTAPDAVRAGRAWLLDADHPSAPATTPLGETTGN